MTRSDLIDLLASDQTSLSERDVELAVAAMLRQMSDALASGSASRSVDSAASHFIPVQVSTVPHFKSGKELRERVNAGMAA